MIRIEYHDTKGLTSGAYATVHWDIEVEPPTYLTSESDPVLARIWDNDEDDVYNDL